MPRARSALAWLLLLAGAALAVAAARPGAGERLPECMCELSKRGECKVNEAPEGE